MAYTVKQLAAMSGVRVRTLHFYDETGLLEPAYCGANGYRFYEKQQLLTLQQILFYRELGFELKQIKRVLGRADFEVATALRAHRKVLTKNFTRTRRLIQTIDKTVKHLKGSTRMSAEEMYQPAGKMEDFFREVGRFTTTPIHEVLGIEGMVTLFKSHGMELSGAPLSGQWHVDEQGRIHRLA